MEEEFKNPLISIPQKKIDYVIRKVIDSFPEDTGKTITQGLSNECALIISAIQRYALANIPADYWFISMENDYKGDPTLLNTYNNIVVDIDKAYFDGIRFCLCGNHGVGKTFTACCVLKFCVEKGYSAQYTTLTDLVNILASPNNENKQYVRDYLLKVDFLVIDEFDPRFFSSSDSATDLYGRILEPTMRTRIQNRLPIFLCTNSPNVLSSFTGSLKQSITSLMNLVTIVPVLGDDYRTIKKVKK